MLSPRALSRLMNEASFLHDSNPLLFHYTVDAVSLLVPGVVTIAVDHLEAQSSSARRKGQHQNVTCCHRKCGQVTSLRLFQFARTD